VLALRDNGNSTATGGVWLFSKTNVSDNPRRMLPGARNKALSLLTTVLDCSVPKRYASDGFEKGRGMRVGYARVSTTDQSPKLQLDALRRAGCEKIHTEEGIRCKSGPARTRARPR
jgi:hypothetical protein